MTSGEFTSQYKDIDLHRFITLIGDFAIARRSIATYPAGHPLITDILAKTIAAYNSLLDQVSELQIGLTKDAVLVNGEKLQTTQQTALQFTKALFERGIAVLTMHNGLTVDELHAFIAISSMKRDQIVKQGGIELLWQKSGIKSLAIIPFDYSLLGKAEYTSSDTVPTADNDIWQQLTRMLIPDGGATSEGGLAEDLDPEILAEIFNRHNSFRQNNSTADVTAFFHQDSLNAAVSHNALAVEKMAAFVSRLNPELRRQFITCSYSLTGKKNTPITETLMQSLPRDILLETISDFDSKRQQISPVIMGLIDRLANHDTHATHHKATSDSSDGTLHEKMKTILREHPTEEFVPEDYQRKLNHLIATQQLPALPQLADREILLQTASEDQVEKNISDIALLMLSHGYENAEEREALLQNLEDTFRYSLQTGDYQSALHHLRALSDELLPAEIRCCLREQYGQQQYIDEILSGLTVWGKTRYPEIKEMITTIGAPCIEPLLDTLAVEKSLSLRRFLIDRLIELGPATRDPVASRLDDQRWFVVRNLIIILKSLADPTVVSLLKPLLTHQNQKVRHEALAALLAMGDLTAQHQLCIELEQSDHEARLAAIRLSEKCLSREVGKKLLEIVTSAGWSASELEDKIAAVHALGEQHLTIAIPELAKLLGSTSFFHAKPLLKLKLEIIKSLEHYPVSMVLPILERVAQENDACGKQALLSLQNMKAKGEP